MGNSKFQEYIQTGNVEAVRKELLGIFNSNPDLGNGEFIKELHYAEQKLGKEKLYQRYSNNFSLISNRNEWTSGYVAKIFLYLRKEFAKEIVEHLIDVAPVAYKDKVNQRDQKKQTPILNNEKIQNVEHLIDVAPVAYKDKVNQRDQKKQTPILNNEKIQKSYPAKQIKEIIYLAIGVCLVVGIIILAVMLASDNS